MSNPTLEQLLNDIEADGYINEPIGGGNPYYRCYNCQISDLQINGRLGGHAEWCEWAIEQKRRIIAETVLADTTEENLELKEAIRHKIDKDFYTYRLKKLPTKSFAVHMTKGEDGRIHENVGWVVSQDLNSDHSFVHLMFCNGNVWYKPVSEVRLLRKDERYKIGCELAWRVLMRHGISKGGYMSRNTKFGAVSRRWGGQ